jgi:hypothetical protein
MQRIISSAIALGLLIVGLCFLYLELFADYCRLQQLHVWRIFGRHWRRRFVDFVSSFLRKHHDD